MNRECLTITEFQSLQFSQLLTLLLDSCLQPQHGLPVVKLVDALEATWLSVELQNSSEHNSACQRIIFELV